MTGPLEERTYRWPRRYVFSPTLAVIIPCCPSCG